jgi:hypothetical protein
MWEQINYPERVMLLYDGQNPTPESPSLSQKWRPYYTFIAYNPLIMPYPPGMQLFRAIHAPHYPYELTDIVPIRDVFNVEQPGTYFVAFTSPFDGTSRIPFAGKYIFVQGGQKI